MSQNNNRRLIRTGHNNEAPDSEGYDEAQDQPNGDALDLRAQGVSAPRSDGTGEYGQSAFLAVSKPSLTYTNTTISYLSNDRTGNRFAIS